MTIFIRHQMVQKVYKQLVG